MLTKTIIETASKLRLYAKKFNTSIYVCMHCSTEALRKVHPAKHQYEGLPIRPNAADAEGGGSGRIVQMILISIHRHRYTQSQTDWMFTQIHVLKVKSNSEDGGSPTYTLMSLFYLS